jgi:predicted lysophospholipase L1 biosynthesis ABC-type transport system permease subunit
MDTMRIPFLNGRDFNVADNGPAVAIVNQAFAKQFFNGENPVGRWFEGGRGRARIVGLVPDARSRDNVRIPIRPIVYLPFQGVDAKGAVQMMGRGTFVVRTSSANPMAMASTLRQEVPRARSEFHVGNIRAQSEINRAHTLRERLLAMLAVFFAAVALLLAAIGLYGVMAYSVAVRRTEIGIRAALGATPRTIFRDITREGVTLAALGAAIGLLAAFGVTRLLRSMLYGVPPGDPLTFVSAAAVLIAVAALASALPGLRAAHTDPVETLRN